MAGEWTIGELLIWTQGYFRGRGIADARLEAELLLAHALNRNRVYLYANYDAPSNLSEREAYRSLIKRRAAGEPLAYITGVKEFMSLEFKVSPEVLIPRPETELLVERVIELAGKAFAPAKSPDIFSEISAPARDTEYTIKICDVGTGSGAIAISLAYYLPEARLYATDLSPAALEIARDNAAQHGVLVNFFEGDLLTPVQEAGPFNIIAANLPYISAAEYSHLDRGIIDYEPRQALLATGDGLDLYRRLLPQAWDLLTPGGYILYEIGSEQGQSALALMDNFMQAELLRDLAGRDRVIVARKNGEQSADRIY